MRYLKRMLRNAIYLSVLAGSIFCFPDFSSAQQTGTITGTVLDGSDEPVDFASATLLALPDSSFVAGAQTESGGKFTDRKSVVSGKGVLVRVDLGGRSIIQKKKHTRE